MEQEYSIQDPVALRIWNQYFKRVDYVLNSVPPLQREEITMELRHQLYEHYTIDDAFTEADKMLNAIDKLGEPEEYLKPIIEDIKVSEVLVRYNPVDVFKKLFDEPFANLRQFLFCTVMLLGYIFLFLIFLISILKIIIPEIGVYFHESGGISIGITSDPNAVELLGYWLIPIGLIFSSIMYIALTKILEHISGQ
jgi:uncharacterized membrane protein